MEKLSVKQWEKRYDKLSRTHNSLVKAVETLEGVILQLETRNTFLEAQMENAAINVDINKDIMRKQLTEGNAKEQDYITEINELKGIIRDLRK